MSTDPRCQNPECPVPENERPRGACRIPNFRNRKRGSTACTAFVPAEPAGQPTAEDCDRYRADVGLPLPAPEQGCEHEPELLHIKEVARSYGYAVLPADVVAQVRAFIRVAKDNAFGGGPPPKTADDNRRIYADALLAALPKEADDAKK